MIKCVYKKLRADALLRLPEAVFLCSLPNQNCSVVTCGLWSDR